MNTPIVIELLFDDPVIAAEVLGQLEQREDAHHHEDGGSPRLDAADIIHVLDGGQFQARVTAAQGVGPWTDAERESAGWPLLGRACLDREVASRVRPPASVAPSRVDLARTVHQVAMAAGWPVDIPIEDLSELVESVATLVRERDAARAALLFSRPADKPIDGRLTLTITNIPADASPASLARLGELLGLEANGPDDNPSARAWIRAGISASALIRTVYKGEMSMDMLVAMIACNCDPDHDTSTPQREALIRGHRCVEHEWATGETDGREVEAEAVAATDSAEIGRRWLADSSLKEWFPLTAAHLEELEIELTRLRARARIEADDVERAGVTWAQLAAWAAAGETKAHMGARLIVGYFAADGEEPQGAEAAEAIADRINWMVDECEPGRCALDILGEMAAERGNSMSATPDREPDQLVNHPAHYGGAENPFEAIKVIEAWDLGFCTGNAVKYLSRAGKKPGEAELRDLQKSAWYIQRRIEQIEKARHE